MYHSNGMPSNGHNSNDTHHFKRPRLKWKGLFQTATLASNGQDSLSCFVMSCLIKSTPRLRLDIRRRRQMTAPTDSPSDVDESEVSSLHNLQS
ncbi:hypothetical protein HanIR_Chr12g0591121 [Helianthus annuus]|nr:hypothetical protein HanIR_Chr12g0591121 [Helianthus annuus]